MRAKAYINSPSVITAERVEEAQVWVASLRTAAVGAAGSAWWAAEYLDTQEGPANWQPWKRLPMRGAGPGAAGERADAHGVAHVDPGKAKQDAGEQVERLGDVQAVHDGAAGHVNDLRRQRAAARDREVLGGWRNRDGVGWWMIRHGRPPGEVRTVRQVAPVVFAHCRGCAG